MKLISSVLLTFLFALPLMAAERVASITVDSRTTYQHVSGFGGFSPSPQWAYWLGDNEMNKLFGKSDSQLGLNILRLYIANNKNAWGAGVANAKNAKKNGAIIFASPWSPPAAWKSNNSDSNGGELLESHWKDWAIFLNDYYKYMKSQGVTIDAISIQNEPDWNATYQSCIWTGAKMAKFLKEYGSLIECKIIAPEAIHFTKNMHEPILNDDEACAQLDILGGHFYGWDGSSYPLAAQKGKEVWMTEFLINERQEQEKKNINWNDDGFLFARSINDAMLANMSAWVHYSLKRYYGCLGDGNYGTTDNAITKRGYVLSHYAKYVSGTTRIRHFVDDVTGKLTSSAYLSVTGDSVVVMVINPSADSYRTTINLPFNTAALKTVVTSATLNARKTDNTLEAETYQPVLDVAPYSVNTYIFKKSSARDDMADDEEGMSGEEVFADNFELAGGSCIPKGWRSRSEEGIRQAGNYSLGPRIMGFSREGAMPYAFYFRTGNTSKGYVSYGEETNYRLALTPGKYSLTYSVVGWKANPAVKFCLRKAGSTTNLKYIDSKPDGYISESGSSVRVKETTDFKVDMDIDAQGNYVLMWEMPQSTGGFNEALLGNVKLVRYDDATDVIVVEADAASSSQPAEVYDLLGRKQTVKRQGVTIVRTSDGTVKKVVR